MSGTYEQRTEELKIMTHAILDLYGTDGLAKVTTRALEIREANSLPTQPGAEVVIPSVHVYFTCEEGEIIGSQSVNVKRVTANDDGSFLVELDYWPPVSSQPSPKEWCPTHRHVKRGSTYCVIGEAEAQVSLDSLRGYVAQRPSRILSDGDRLTVYQGADGKLWVRFRDEFNDGRFERLPDAASEEITK